MAEDPRNDNEPSRLPVLIGFVIIVALVVMAYWLTMALRHQGQMEDCLMSGRSNCAPLDVPANRR